MVRPGGLLAGLNLLVVEDETIVSFLVEDMLLELGSAAVRVASSVGEALNLIGEYKPDAALLDVNLGRDTVYPVAERLAAADIPFVFATGYGRGGIAEHWLDKPIIQKPYDLNTLAETLRAALAS